MNLVLQRFAHRKVLILLWFALAGFRALDLLKGYRFSHVLSVAGLLLAGCIHYFDPKPRAEGEPERDPAVYAELAPPRVRKTAMAVAFACIALGLYLRWKV